METAGRQLDQKDLARAMRHAGLGTPATRAAILQTLLNRKYLRRDKRALRATESGRALIAAIPVEELKSPVMTGRWEKRLAEVAEGHHPRSQFMADVVSHVQRVVDAIRGAALPEAALVRTRPLSDALGSCPHCDTPVRARGPVFTCDTGRACPFVVFSTMSGRKISTRMVKELLSKGKTKPVKGFKSRAGKEFTAGLVVKEDGRVGFWFVDERSDEGTSPARERGGARSVASSGPATRRDDSQSPPPVGASCPACGHGKVLAGRRAFGCSRWREGCGWRMPFEEAGRGL
jgi:DNA topoisomerase-3